MARTLRTLKKNIWRFRNHKYYCETKNIIAKHFDANSSRQLQALRKDTFPYWNRREDNRKWTFLDPNKRCDSTKIGTKESRTGSCTECGDRSGTKLFFLGASALIGDKTHGHFRCSTRYYKCVPKIRWAYGFQPSHSYFRRQSDGFEQGLAWLKTTKIETCASPAEVKFLRFHLHIGIRLFFLTLVESLENSNCFLRQNASANYLMLLI